MIYSTTTSHTTQYAKSHWNNRTNGKVDNSDDAEFQKLAHKDKIDIDNITPVFIETIRKKHGWENCTALNFRKNYQRVTNTLRLARGLNRARALKGESFVEFVSFSCIFY